MKGNNGAYKRAPLPFLQRNLIVLAEPKWMGDQDPRGLMAGIQTFDLVPMRYQDTVELKFWDRGAMMPHKIVDIKGMGQGLPSEGYGSAGKRESVSLPRTVGHVIRPADMQGNTPIKSDEAPLKAFWLPWKLNRTFELQLDDQADFFFTAQLSGCTFTVSGQAEAPRVAHINRAETPELQQMHQERTQLPQNLAYKEGFEKQRALATASSFTSLLPPKPTKAGTTSKEMLLQEMKAAAEARAIRLASGAAPRVTAQGGRKPGESAPRKDYMFGYVDWARDYGSNQENLVSVMGYRDTTTRHWKFVYQLLRLRKDATLTRTSEVSNQPVKCGAVMCVVCKNPASDCTCA